MSDWPKDYQEQFWQAYPRRVARKAAMRILDRLKKSGEVTWERLMSGVANYAAQRKDMQFTCHPTTWLNQGRWDDELDVKSGHLASLPAGCWIRLDSPEWRAWTQYRGKPPMMDKRGGWVMPSQWPPGYELVEGGAIAGNG